MSSIINTSRIAIVGLGQLGTSLALRLKELQCRELFGISRRVESLQYAVDNDIIDAGSTDASEVLPVVDMVFICTPLSPTLSFVKANLEHFRVGSIVTDVGSVKGSLVDELRPLLFDKGVVFIGAHPMAGSEREGLEAGRADLYQDAVVFLTPTEEDDADAISLVSTFWQEIGACPLELPAERHDLACAHSSHVAHILATSLVKSVLGKGDTEANCTATAGGFRDTTRIASGNPGMWQDICRHNRGAILQALSNVQGEIDLARQALESEDWDAVYDFFADGKTLRDDWLATHAAKRGYTNDTTE